jgi:esterase/lipase superfamily enzyme
MIPRLQFSRLLVPVCVIALHALAIDPAAGQFERRGPSRGIVRPQLGTSEGDQTLMRARAAMGAQNFALASAEYQSALNLLANNPAFARQREEALRGFAESGVKLAEQRLREGRVAEAERIVRDVLNTRPNYRPAVELLARLEASGEGTSETAPRVIRRGLAARAKKKSEEIAATASPPPPSVYETRSRTLSAATPGASPRRMAREPAGGGPPPEAAGMGAPPPVVVYEGRPVPRPSRPPVGEESVKPAEKPLVKVFFATDRLPSGANGPSKYFGKDWNKQGDHLLTGFVKVSIPPVHKEGQVERPWKIFTYERKEDAAKHFVLKDLQISKGDDFYGVLRSEYDKRPPEQRSAFVFIHGFNVTFDEAAYRTAQLAYDLRFEGVPMMYSWPSQGRLLAYNGDEEATNWSSPHLQSFLERVARESGSLRIHLIAHSMGNRVLANALVGLGRQPDIQPLFDNVIMAAPDVNAYTFTDQIWPDIQKAAKRFTLYASSDDQALVTSKKAKGSTDFDRLGEAGPKIVVLPGLDTVDASGIDTSLLGHSYVDSCKPVMKDLGLLIEKGLAPLQRKLRQKEGLAYWVFP